MLSLFLTAVNFGVQLLAGIVAVRGRRSANRP